MLSSRLPSIICLLLAFVGLKSCKTKSNDEHAQFFTLLDHKVTGVSFANNIAESDSLNILDYLYFYNGAGVAAADFNNDGLEDLYFVSNQGSNKLYLNKTEPQKGGSDIRFEDITEKSGTAGVGSWKTGVTVVDINNDGYQDIYVSVVSGYKSLSGKNQLFINNGNLTFTESAGLWGLDFAGLSTQAAFFDYDKDGDLDMFQLTHSVHSNDTYGDSRLRFKYDNLAGDHLFRNDQDHFTDVTSTSGIYSAPIGYGLGVSIADFNNDGWDDIYVSNDFFEQDYYYINQQDGTFKERLTEAFGHTSLFSMGNAAGDINMDGYLDLLTTDMLPDKMKALKSTINDEPLDIYNLEVKSGFYYQYSRNTLQLNVAAGKKFVDIGLYSGVAATEWTWSPLIQDFDMNGRKDFFFSNGIKRRLNDLDYLKYLGSTDVLNDFDSNRKFDRHKIEKMPDGRVPNILFTGDSALKFSDVSEANNISRPSSSSGAVSVDLDNDGDLEIVTNNMDEPAFIYENTIVQARKAGGSNFLNLSVEYKGRNRGGIGTKLFMKSSGGEVDHQEIQTSTAFQSNQNANLLFTFAGGERPVALLVIWPDNSQQIITRFDLGTKQKIVYDPETVRMGSDSVASVIRKFIKGSAEFSFQDMDAELLAELKVSQTPDFNYYSLLPHNYSKPAPAVAAGDINGDGYDDLYVGGIKGEEKYLLIGAATGKFKKVQVPAFTPFTNHADAEAQWIDLDNDNKLDLIVTNAEHPLLDFSQIQPHRIFFNRGNLKFEARTLPAIRSLTSKMALIDYNDDGLTDIFLPAAVYFKNYTKILPSVLLLNRGHGRFDFAAASAFTELASLSFVKDLTVADLNNDGKQDLVVSSEWQPLQIFLNTGRGLKKYRSPQLENLSGWWQSAKVADVDQDGKLDLIAGNWGLNNKYNVTQNHPLYAYNSDLDQDGKSDLIISYFDRGRYYPFRPKNDLEQELPYLRKEWLSYRKMADKSTEEIFKDRLSEKERLAAGTFESVLISDIAGRQVVNNLPHLYQQAPIISLVTGEKPNQIVIGGNFWGAIPYEGRYDALGLATLEYNAAAKQFLPPRYWINPLVNFSEISYMRKIRAGKKDIWIVLTGDGKLLQVSALRPM
jgi:hypothetical protein